MAEQLRLFMTAGELRNQYRPYLGDMVHGGFYGKDISDSEHRNNFWDSKAKEAEESGLLDSIKEHGVKNPVAIYNTRTPNSPVTGGVLNGHHRIAAAYKLNPDQFVPVVYEDPSNPNLFQRA